MIMTNPKTHQNLLLPPDPSPSAPSGRASASLYSPRTMAAMPLTPAFSAAARPLARMADHRVQAVYLGTSGKQRFDEAVSHA